MTGLGVLATGIVATSAEEDVSGKGPGLLAFVIVVALAVACWLLYRSLRSHLGQVKFDEGTPARPPRRRGAWRPGEPWPESPGSAPSPDEPPLDR